MKYILALFLILNFLTETLASAGLIATGMSAAATSTDEMWSLHYGFAALAVASASIWLWFQRTSRAALTAVLGILCVFHTGLLLSLLTEGIHTFGIGAHATLAVLALVLLFQRDRLAT